MIRINLIPKKVSKKKMGILQNLIIAGVVYLLAIGGIAYVWTSLNTKLSTLRQQVAKAEQEKRELQGVHEEKKKYEDNITRLKNQLDIISKIKQHRFLPIRLFDDLTLVLDKKTPVWINTYSMDRKGIRFSGYSLTNKDLANFVTRLEKSPFFKNVNLLFSKKEKRRLSEKTDRVVYNFSITAKPQTSGKTTRKPRTE